jgi:hypothetical protein
MMASTRRPERGRRARWLAFLLGLLAGAMLWWFLFHAARRGSLTVPPPERRMRSLQ